MKFNGKIIQSQTHSTPLDVNEPWDSIAHPFAIERRLAKLSLMCGLGSGTLGVLRGTDPEQMAVRPEIPATIHESG